MKWWVLTGIGVDVDVDDRERDEAGHDANAAVKIGRANISRVAQFLPQMRLPNCSINSAASPKHGSESNTLSCPSLAHTTTNAARASSASWGDALVANMVIVQSVCVYPLP